MTQVLIVEDDEATSETLAELLTDVGYVVWTAPNGLPALPLLRTHPDGLVVLLDLMMPVMDGYALLQQVAVEPPLASQHTYILMSAVVNTLPFKMVELCMRLQVTELPKPFELEEVLAVVEHAAQRLHQRTS